MQPESARIVIVGAGPVGMTVALELARHGVHAELIEQNEHTTQHPKMDLLNARSMELLNRLGLTEAVRDAGVSPEHPYDVVFSTGGRVVGRWELPSVQRMRATITATEDGSAPGQPWQRISQTVLEPILRAACVAAPQITLRTGVRFLGFAETPTGVECTTDQDQARPVRGTYLVGADGADSAVRRAVGIGLADPVDAPDLPEICQIHFRSRDFAVLHRHGQFWRHLGLGWALIAQDERDTWTLHIHATEPGQYLRPPADPAGLARTVLGEDLVIDRVLVTSVWRPRFLLAEHYVAGRTALAGDAAHQMFPTGAYGLNTGLAEATNLAWKLAMLMRGVGGPVLLDSYEKERRPIAAEATKMSFRHLTVHLRAGDMADRACPDSEIGALLERERGENEYTGLELGHHYGKSPITVPDTTAAQPPYRPDAYEPSTVPGARLPYLAVDERRSTHTVLGKEFTVLDLSTDGSAARDLERSAGRRAIPLRREPLVDRRVRALAGGHELILVRPDQHVAWRGNTPPPDLLDRVLGHGDREH